MKRAERPPAEFWNQFERELRAKQLAALVVKRPWWRTLPARAFAGFSRYHLPLGATAVLAITFLSVREYQTVTPEGVVLPVLNDEVFATSASAATVAGPAEGAFLVGEVKPVAVASESAPSVSREADMSTESGAQASPAMAVLTGRVDDSVREASPSARSIANNFAAVQSAESPFGGRSFLGSTVHGFESRAMPARQPVVDPLAQMKAPSDVRRARYLGTALPASVGMKTATARSSERLASRIADERLYETGPSRLGVGGDRLMVKF
ncbi:MAG: hypothetical protein NTZ29_13910 [Verrucomicrobia bacterium]|nr:hypothetical protein [Verrucomicrobiota bacterium]